MVELLLAYMLIFTVHEAGHDVESHRQHIAASWHTERTGLVFRTQGIGVDPQKLAMVGGAGFRAQDLATSLAVRSRWERPLRASSAILKLTYLPWPDGIHPNDSGGISGDLRMIEQVTPGARWVVAASGLLDLYRAYRPDDSWNISYHQWQNGASGLRVDVRF